MAGTEGKEEGVTEVKAEDVTEAKEKGVEDLYVQRADLFQLAMALGLARGWKGIGVRSGTEGSQWPVLVITIPDHGEISIHAARKDIIWLEAMTTVDQKWDGEGDEVKHQRIAAFVKGHL